MAVMEIDNSNFKIRNSKSTDRAGDREILDPIRRRWVALTPEEWVRQQTVMMLHQQYGWPLELMQVETAITVGNMTKRCDIVLYDRNVAPVVIVECKEERVELTQKVVDQACRYNITLQVPYLLLTNGRQLLCLSVDSEKQTLRQTEIPNFSL